jgi:hypothetical protein
MLPLLVGGCHRWRIGWHGLGGFGREPQPNGPPTWPCSTEASMHAHADEGMPPGRNKHAHADEGMPPDRRRRAPPKAN